MFHMHSQHFTFQWKLLVIIYTDDETRKQEEIQEIHFLYMYKDMVRQYWQEHVITETETEAHLKCMSIMLRSAKKVAALAV